MLCISTPNLDYLEISFRKETVAKGVVLQEMGSLYEADFSFELDIANIPREFVLLSKILNVTSLRLGGSGVVLKSMSLLIEGEENSHGEGRGDLARGTLKSKCLKTVEIQCPEGSNMRQLERVLLASIEDPYRVRIILPSY